jgi:integrase
MLTDVALKALRPKEKPYKITDRDGMYVLVSAKEALSFRLDYRLNGRRETVVLGRYDPLCGAIVERGAPATALHVRDIIKQIYGFAILHGEKVANPADEVGPSAIAHFTPRDRSLSPTEIRIMLKRLDRVATLPTIRLGLRLILLTMVRKSEPQDAVWDESILRTRFGRFRRSA